MWDRRRREFVARLGAERERFRWVYSYCRSEEDAEDAFQTAIAIALEKMPEMQWGSAQCWFSTVLKHEAYRLWRLAGQSLEKTAPGFPPDAMAGEDPFIAIEDRDRLKRVLGRFSNLKTQERRALLDRLDGLSYAEIAETNGWTYTKVNRCITEGRAALRASVDETVTQT